MKPKTIFYSICFLLIFNCTKSQNIATINTLELKKLLHKEKVQLLDVRTPEEVAKGKIKNAFSINYFDTDFTKKASSKLDKNKKVYLYCRTGNRSNKAAILLKEKGYNVVNVLGGYNKWELENLKE